MQARRFLAVVASSALILGLAAPVQALASASPLPMPTSMAALGDSITIAYDIKSLLRADPTFSWSAGTQPAVNSLYTRLDAKNGTATITRYNLAVPGTRIADLAGQAGRVKDNTDLVTILMGANDACTRTETGSTGMTSVETFKSSAEAAFGALARNGVKQVVVASIPDVYKLWFVGKDSPSAGFTWGLFGICQSMLKNPTSLKPADEERRVRVRARIAAFNEQLALSCTAATIACKFDGNKVYDTSFALTDISRVDYFHPSASGQALLAQMVFDAAGF